PPAASNASAKGSRQVADATLDLHTRLLNGIGEPRGDLLLLEAQLRVRVDLPGELRERGRLRIDRANDRLRCRHAGSLPLSAPLDHPAFAARSDTVTPSG